MTLKVTGHQWYWTYEYPDQGGSDLRQQHPPRRIRRRRRASRAFSEVDNPVVVPVGTVVRILVTGTDVIHSWFVPSMGVQEYAVIGRINESWMSVNHVGTYYGQCNQICGVNHPFMPIEIKAVSKDDFAKWVVEREKEIRA